MKNMRTEHRRLLPESLLPLVDRGRDRRGGVLANVLLFLPLVLAGLLAVPLTIAAPPSERHGPGMTASMQRDAASAQDRRDDEGHPPGRSSDSRVPQLSDAQRQQVLSLHDRFLTEYERDAWDEGLETLREILSIDPNDTIALYNAACVQIKLGEHDKAALLLEKAVLAGFVDFEHMKRDPDLDPIREHERYKAIEQAIGEAYTLSAERMTAWAKERLSSSAIVETDDTHRFVYATEFEQDIHDTMKEIISRQMDWQMEHLFGGAPNSFVLLVVPSPENAARLIGSVRIGGYYDHDARKLVTRDIGSSLRHEITHALHHAHMDRLGQEHPMWVQEGLASLFELYEFDPASNRLVVHDNTRINIAINLRRVGGLTEWEDLFRIPDRKFNASRPRARYAEVRAIFQFLAEREQLANWYRTYTETYNADPTGALAFERTFGMDVRAVEREFKAWLSAREKLPEKIEPDRPSIGIWIADQAANNGVMIVGVHPDGSAKHAGVRQREVISRIDGRPVFSVEEVLHYMHRHADSLESVTLELRIGDRVRELEVELAPLEGDDRRRTRPRSRYEYFQEPGVAV